jgi:hypothetical protein
MRPAKAFLMIARLEQSQMVSGFSLGMVTQPGAGARWARNQAGPKQPAL